MGGGPDVRHHPPSHRDVRHHPRTEASGEVASPSLATTPNLRTVAGAHTFLRRLGSAALMVSPDISVMPRLMLMQSNRWDRRGLPFAFSQRRPMIRLKLGSLRN
jgi:hypothetical protein